MKKSNQQVNNSGITITHKKKQNPYEHIEQTFNVMKLKHQFPIESVCSSVFVIIVNYYIYDGILRYFSLSGVNVVVTKKEQIIIIKEKFRTLNKIF